MIVDYFIVPLTASSSIIGFHDSINSYFQMEICQYGIIDPWVRTFLMPICTGQEEEGVASGKDVVDGIGLLGILLLTWLLL